MSATIRRSTLTTATRNSNMHARPHISLNSAADLPPEKNVNNTGHYLATVGTSIKYHLKGPLFKLV